METELFNAGQRPAVNVGISVSRVGGAAQTKAMKKVSGSLRMELSQYREMQAFTQFSSDLDPVTKALLDHGDRLMEILKQPQFQPKSMAEQVILLSVCNSRLLQDIELSKVGQFVKDLWAHFESEHQDVIKEITDKKVITEELVEQIKNITVEFKE